MTETLFNYDLNRADPFLSKILTGLPFLGIIRPHPGLAEALKTHLNLGDTASYVIPGEDQLAREKQDRRRESHYPEVYLKILATLHIPFPGAVFIVAGGLLGKVYCARIKELGGIALDVGAIVDAWMGYNTRPGHFDSAVKLPVLS